jgi:hypothetical protein
MVKSPHLQVLNSTFPIESLFSIGNDSLALLEDADNVTSTLVPTSDAGMEYEYEYETCQPPSASGANLTRAPALVDEVSLLLLRPPASNLICHHKSYLARPLYAILNLDNLSDLSNSHKTCILKVSENLAS